MEDNYYSAPGAKGTFVRKNRYLEKYLNKIGRNTEEVWDSILDFRGSVQHLDFLDDYAKEVFKTAHEINQFELIRQAADRQPYICQGQSLNLRVHPEASPKYLSELHLSAWKAGLKSLYYLKSKSLLVKNRPNAQKTAFIITKEECPYCSMAKSLLRSQGWIITEVDRAEYKGEWDEKWKTVPQIWLKDQHVGGYNDLVEYLKPKDVEKVYAECAACGG
jgi:ribonucleoside-diphosphate reductase alpha chain